MVGPFTFSEVIIYTVFAALDLAGLWLLWRLALSPAARAKGVPSRLAEWPIGWIGFGVLVGGAVLAGAAGEVGAFEFFRPDRMFGHTGPNGTIVEGSSPELRENLVEMAATLAVVVWCLGYRKLAEAGKGFAPMIRLQTALAGGAATFLIMMTTDLAVGCFWRAAMQSAGAQPEAQDVVIAFKAIKSPEARVLFLLVAVVGAPVAEELVFRGGLYHFARTRLPRWQALLVPACLWAAMHGSLTVYVPIVVSGVILSLAYERTGNLAVPMVAHGLSNLIMLSLVWFSG
jgi:hypothetical protein